MTRISRFPLEFTAKMGSEAADSSIIEKGEHKTGSIQLPADSSTTKVLIYSQIGSGEWVQAEDKSEAEIEMDNMSAGVPREFPSSVYSLPRIKLVAEVATGTGETDPESVEVFITS